MATIGIVTAMYNGARHLADTIAAVRGQTERDWDWIIVDDGSRDESGALAEAAARVDSRIHVVHQDNAGAPRARNAGIAQLAPDTRYVIVVDADDMWAPDALAALRAALDDHPQALAAHGWARYVDTRGKPLRRIPEFGISHHRRVVTAGGAVRLLRDDEPTTYDTLLFHNVIVTPGALMIRHDALPDELYDPATGPSADYDFSLRVARSGSIFYLSKPVIDYRVHETSMSRDGAVMAGALRCVYAKHRLFEAGSELKLIARATYRDRWRTLAHKRMRWAHALAKEGRLGSAAWEVARALRDDARSHNRTSLTLP